MTVPVWWAMTEAEWVSCADPDKMLHVVQQSRPSERKVRLFNAAICRRSWGYLPEAAQAILSQSESLADGLMLLGADKLNRQANAIVAPLDRQYPNKQFPSTRVRIQRDAAAAVCYAVVPGELWGAVGYFWDIDPAEKRPHSGIIRDIFGNPFRPVTISPSWQTPAVVALAQAAYENRILPAGTLENARLAVLADALEEAGCTDSAILGHCRSAGPHVRGCWVVDLVLGKE